LKSPVFKSISEHLSLMWLIDKALALPTNSRLCVVMHIVSHNCELNRLMIMIFAGDNLRNGSCSWTDI